MLNTNINIKAWGVRIACFKIYALLFWVQMSIICFSWIMSALDKYHPRQMSIIFFSWISSAGHEYHATKSCGTDFWYSAHKSRGDFSKLALFNIFRFFPKYRSEPLFCFFIDSIHFGRGVTLGHRLESGRTDSWFTAWKSYGSSPKLGPLGIFRFWP
jgi:hypothetical protein